MGCWAATESRNQGAQMIEALSGQLQRGPATDLLLPTWLQASGDLLGRPNLDLMIGDLTGDRRITLEQRRPLPGRFPLQAQRC
jgi:hypothetical protein